MGEHGGDCWAEGSNYVLWCQECGLRVAAYFGETGRNSFTRGLDHLDLLEARSKQSVLWLHSLHHHQGRDDVVYRMRVTGVYPDPMDRQIMEGVNISRFQGPVLMNRRTEMGGVRVERMRYRRWGGGLEL